MNKLNYLLIPAIILLLIGNGILYSKINNLNKKFLEVKKEQTDQQASQKESIENLQNLVTFNWKIYRNEKYGFEIKYPKDFSKFEEDYAGTIEDKTSLFWIQFSSPKTEEGYPSIAIYIPRENNQDKAINNYINTIETTIETEQETTVDGISGKTITISSNNSLDAKHSLFVTYKSKVYQIQIFERNPIFGEKILSTFKFIK